MKVLITGGLGFVGRWFTSELLSQNSSVHVVDNIKGGSGAIWPGSKWLHGNPKSNRNFSSEIRDCRDFFAHDKSKWDLVIHLAAVVGGRLTIELNPLAVAEDLAIDAEFWQWALKSKPKKIVHFSSSAAYPVNLQSYAFHKPLIESDIDFERGLSTPDLTYGWAKLTSEYLAKFAAEQYGLQVYNFRPFSGYGEDQDLSYPFPAIIKRAITAKKSNSKDNFIVWGSGLQERDFIHISDVVRLVLKTVKLYPNVDALNLGSGIATNFITLAKKILNQLDLNADVVGLGEMPEGVFSRCADISKMNNLIGSPKISLEEGIRLSIKYVS
jgi:GDP-L-fucose synthase